MGSVCPGERKTPNEMETCRKRGQGKKASRGLKEEKGIGGRDIYLGEQKERGGAGQTGTEYKKDEEVACLTSYKKEVLVLC